MFLTLKPPEHCALPPAERSCKNIFSAIPPFFVRTCPFDRKPSCAFPRVHLGYRTRFLGYGIWKALLGRRRNGIFETFLQVFLKKKKLKIIEDEMILIEKESEHGFFLSALPQNQIIARRCPTPVNYFVPLGQGWRENHFH